MIPARFPRLSRMVGRQLAVFPEHEAFLRKRFASLGDAEFGFAEQIAEKILQIAGPHLESICEDYRWLNDVVLHEELHFRRTGRYRLSTFAEANAEFYSNAETMTRYMNGLLASQLWWRNHTEMLRYYRKDFIERLPTGFKHLEIGPGHGLFLYFAAACANCLSAEAWDVSEASLSTARSALDRMHASRDVVFQKTDIFRAPQRKFDSIVFSEVLEHLERPQEALRILGGLIEENGRIFVNAPVNSPAPDHLYLFETPEQILEMIADAGFAVESHLFSPCTGVTLERARAKKLTISVGAVIRRA
jgi:2-polyprenyl-3-methyl-5-hydroxy-6-metoxy-1,4-benzoquinol methylase